LNFSTYIPWILIPILLEFYYLYSLNFTTYILWILVPLFLKFYYLDSLNFTTCIPWILLPVFLEFYYLYSLNFTTCIPWILESSSIICCLNSFPLGYTAAWDPLPTTHLINQSINYSIKQLKLINTVLNQLI